MVSSFKRKRKGNVKYRESEQITRFVGERIYLVQLIGGGFNFYVFTDISVTNNVF